MFLRKLFSTKNKLVWVLVDLMIVIIGVYCAFLIQQSAEQQSDRKSGDRVLTALKFELETFRFIMTQVAAGMNQKHGSLSSILDKGSYEPFGNYRFIEPQYDYQAIKYALSLQNTSIVDFQLNETLQRLWVEIKKIEHVERLLTETSSKYRTIPRKLAPESETYQLFWAENFDHFGRYLMFINDRASIAQQVVSAANSSLQIINQRLGAERTANLEREIISKYILSVASNEEEAVQLGKKFYPHIPEEEVRGIFRTASR